QRAPARAVRGRRALFSEQQAEVVLQRSLHGVFDRQRQRLGGHRRGRRHAAHERTRDRRPLNGPLRGRNRLRQQPKQQHHPCVFPSTKTARQPGGGIRRGDGVLAFAARISHSISIQNRCSDTGCWGRLVLSARSPQHYHVPCLPSSPSLTWTTRSWTTTASWRI